MKQAQYFLQIIVFVITLQTHAQQPFPINDEPVFTNLDSAIKHKGDVLNLFLYYTFVVPEKLHLIAEMPRLKFLSITGMYLEELPPEIFTLKNIRGLKLSYGFKEIPEQIRNFKNLEYLDVRFNSISKIPDWISDLKSLKTLIVSQNPIKKISDSIVNCKNLKYLDLSRIWDLKFLPDCLGKLSSLEHLHINNSSLYWLPENIKGLKNLITLNASGNRLQEIPNGIVYLKKLKVLNLAGNNVSHLPYFFDSLVSLEKLDLVANPIKDNVTLRLPVSLKSIQLVNSRLHAIPEAIRHCLNLENLQITRSEISSIPIWINNLKKLKSLNLSNNKISTLPSFLKHNKSLGLIDLSYNRIETVPLGILSMPELKYFLISGNKITHIPKDILTSQSLEYFAITKSNIDSTAYRKMKASLKGQVVFERTDLLKSKNYVVGPPCYCDEKPPKTIPNSEPAVFTKSDFGVSFAKKEEGMRSFFEENVNFPKIKQAPYINGRFTDTVLLSFALFPASGITYVTPVRFKREETKNEALRLLRLSCSYWNPATAGSREVKAFAQVAFIFEQFYENGQLKKTLTVKQIPLH